MLKNKQFFVLFHSSDLALNRTKSKTVLKKSKVYTFFCLKFKSRPYEDTAKIELYVTEVQDSGQNGQKTVHRL